MNQQEIYQNMTKGEWRIITPSVHPNILVPETKNAIYLKIEKVVSFGANPDENDTANANAVVSAVNNTYGKGINPESVEKMYKALKELVECDYTSGTHLYTAQIQAKEALTAAKLDSNEK